MWLTKDVTIGWDFPWPYDLVILLIGILILIFGVSLLVICIRMFASIGKGTLAPWAPTHNLVVVGIYRNMRNPMITGVLLGLFGESIILSSYAVFLWAMCFFLGNHIYFIKSEEPGLLKRFGNEYKTYFETVPRCSPRRTPWAPTEDHSD